MAPPRNLDEVLDRLPEYTEVAAVPGLAMTLIADHRVASTYAFGVKSAATQATTGVDAWNQTFTIDPWGNLQQNGSAAFTVPAAVISMGKNF